MNLYVYALTVFGTEVRWTDVIDILIVAFLIYQLLLIVRGTGAVQLVLGILSLIVIFFASQWLNLHTVHWILTKILPYLVFIIIILFQHEIRKAFSALGQTPFVRLFSRRLEKQPIDEIILSVTSLASKQIGAIIVLEREMGLKNYMEGGVAIDAKVSYDLLMSIFNTASPLHDGAVIIQRGRLSAAACFLPLTLNPYQARELGSRHRAAIGLCEETDAIAIVVSEETGKISLVYNEQIFPDLDGTELKQRVSDLLTLAPEAPSKQLRKDVTLP